MRIIISKTEKEFTTICSKINKLKLSQYLHSELQKKFGLVKSPIPCMAAKPQKAPLVHKQFDIQLSEEIEARIKCEAAIAGLDPSTYITRIIVDPNLH